MMYSDFTTSTYGKWILTGEHAVVRGHPALVFPVPSKQLCLSYTCTDSELSADYACDTGEDVHLLFWSVLEQGMRLVGESINSLKGHFNIRSNIPVGAGMGASAALSVALARWFVAQNFIDNQALYGFAKSLEDLFHGSSSGLDIVGVMSATGAYFHQGNSTPLAMSWKPNWYLSSCSQIGMTSHCIQHVNKLWQRDAALAQSIDQKMTASVYKAKEALEQHDAYSLSKLTKAMNDAANCFEQWGLVSEDLKKHMQELQALGALAVKPTGSGGGGYVLSLWPEAADNILPQGSIAI